MVSVCTTYHEGTEMHKMVEMSASMANTAEAVTRGKEVAMASSFFFSKITIYRYFDCSSYNVGSFVNNAVASLWYLQRDGLYKNGPD